MTLALRQPMTLPEFLAWEERQELRHEFDGFQPVAMTGGTVAHAIIQRNLAISIGGRLRGKPCAFYGSDLKVVTARTSRYPDGTVSCTKAASDSMTVPEPVVIFEVLSRSTASTDHITKNREYASITSVQRYVMLEQERIGATVFSRSEAGWKGDVLADDAILVMPEIGIEVPLLELYEGLDLSGSNDETPEDVPAR
ncbi:Uma2 family endonuclease [Roseomonas sp. NAR14]|uniref:Uma2 family endonuclease n=1 Tax=Roseomonas acroporae TaxID=2937791 RepID=A0A9X2BWA4_9PROT|nr:Uma2 family endonuclease [Roseomonas acroporae]MCK8787573.1 Uma2 family endonuclease [Roseomonas acroporae]